ncbi:MAG: DUF4440 domain-containing protein [Deltaproteobacteria bacterium]|nr:MAG: DUF4440 domain-containing protein [Deltaproteobacteria bacterium]
MSQAEITAVNRIFEDSVRRRDVERIASIYTADAIALPPGGPIVQGRENIKRLWGSALAEMGVKSVKIETVDLQLAGDLAYEVGRATLALPAGPAIVKFVVVWKKEDAQWRVHRDIWNADAS